MGSAAQYSARRSAWRTRCRQNVGATWCGIGTMPSHRAVVMLQDFVPGNIGNTGADPGLLGKPTSGTRRIKNCLMSMGIKYLIIPDENRSGPPAMRAGRKSIYSLDFV